MKFRDQTIRELIKTDRKSPELIARLLVEFLCSETTYKQYLKNNESRNERTKILLSSALKDFLNNRSGITYNQINELLLLLDQNRATEAFLKYFFNNKGSINFEDLVRGIEKFRGFAMLRYGNLRFAYKELSKKKNEEEIKKALEPYSKLPEELEKEYKQRQSKHLNDIKKREIPAKKTFLLGYLANKIRNIDMEKIKRKKLSPKIYPQNEMKKISQWYNKKYNISDIEKYKAIGKKHTDIYLTWNYIDIYIATSMRNSWEFEETSEVIEKVFATKELSKLGLCYFDPTQSFCENRIDKSLVEGLMLKRASCTWYMAQETDTLGKDSELAATLAQGKPVIAYVPVLSRKEFEKKFKNYSLLFAKKRLLNLEAEGLFEDESLIKEYKKVEKNYRKLLRDFLDNASKYLPPEGLALYSPKHEEFKRKFKGFDKLCRILAIAEEASSERRAETLRRNHPLGIQVNLTSGVANGVLVAKNLRECAMLLYNTLTNNLSFTIRYISEDNKTLVLEEEISKSPFRVITDDVKLTNSFWNFYLEI